MNLKNDLKECRKNIEAIEYKLQTLRDAKRYDKHFYIRDYARGGFFSKTPKGKTHIKFRAEDFDRAIVLETKALELEWRILDVLKRRIANVR